MYKKVLFRKFSVDVEIIWDSAFKKAANTNLFLLDPVETDSMFTNICCWAG